MNDVRLPRLLDANMNEVARLRPTRLSIEPNGYSLSTASMTLPEGEPRVKIRDWVELYTEHGSAGIYRVTRQKDDVGNEQRVTLTHGLCALEDAVIPGEGTLSGSPSSVMQKILGYQKTTMWMRSAVANGPSIEIEYSYTNALEALEDMLGKLPDYALTFDQTSLPWKLGLTALSAEEGAEARLSRNLKSVSIEEDDSKLCTRVYVDDREGYTDGPTIGTWGPVERVLTVPDGATDEEVKAYVDAYLDEHKNPSRVITLDAYDMSRETGESLDAFRLWKKARVPLPGRGDVLSEHITALDYPNVFDDPLNTRVTMGGQERSLSDKLRDILRRTAASERNAAATNRNVSRNASRIQQNITKLEDTYAELVELEGTTANRFNEVSIELDAQKAEIRLKANQTDVNELGSRVSNAEIRISAADAEIKLKADRTITDELGKRMSSAEIAIDGANANITLQASQIDQVEDRISSAEIAIDGANAEIALKVNKNGVISAINVSSEAIKIQAAKINLEGYVTASQLSAQSARIDNIIAGNTALRSLTASGAISAGSFSGDSASFGALSVNGDRLTKEETTVVTGVNLSTRTGTVWVYLSENGTTRYQMTFLTEADLSTTKRTIEYFA